MEDGWRESSRRGLPAGVGPENRVDSLVAAAGAGLAVEHGRAYWPRDVAEPGQAGVADEIEASAAVARDRTATLDVELSPLAVDLRLGDVLPVCQTRRIREALAQQVLRSTGWRTAATSKRSVTAAASSL